MSLVFSAGRKSVDFEWIFADGTRERFEWKEMSPKVTADLMRALNDPYGLFESAKEILLDSIEHPDKKTKQRLVKELFEQMGVASLFHFIETLQAAVDKEQEKK